VIPIPPTQEESVVMEAARQVLAAEIEVQLHQCSGTEAYHRHLFNRLKYTDGVMLMAERCGAFWLIDAIASYQGGANLKNIHKVCGGPDGHQFWILTVDRSGPSPSAVLTCSRDINRSGTPNEVVVRQVIEYTDFPLDRIVLYVANGVLYLPSEH
jgi:hypothetical protein